MKSLDYLASPYSHPDPAVREVRFQAVCRAAAVLMGAGLHVFSPIAHTHPIALVGELPGDWEYWAKYDEAVLQTCRSIVVLQLDGWNASRGVQGERDIATLLHLPTYLVRPDPADLHHLVDVLRTDFAPSRAPEERRTSPEQSAREV